MIVAWNMHINTEKGRERERGEGKTHITTTKRRSNKNTEEGVREGTYLGNALKNGCGHDVHATIDVIAHEGLGLDISGGIEKYGV